MKDILITVSGDRAVGKTTMAKVLGKFLVLLGCKVDYEDIHPVMTDQLKKIDPVLTDLKPWNVKIKST